MKKNETNLLLDQIASLEADLLEARKLHNFVDSLLEYCPDMIFVKDAKDLKFIRFQPSEIMKIAVPLACAWFLHERPLPPTFSAVSILLVAILVPTALIAKQPDLGTALLVVAGGSMVILLAGLRLRYILSAVVLLVPAGWAGWHFMHDYQRQRVLTFLDPQSDPLGSGYHIIQSQIAIGSGGIFGKGFAGYEVYI